MAVVVLIAALIGLNFSILKYALGHTTPIMLAAFRTVIGGSVLLSFAKLRGEKLPSKRRDYLNIFVVSFSITTLSSALLIFGVSKVPAGLGSLIASTVPLFTALLAWKMLSQAINATVLFALALGFGGTILLAAPTMSGTAAVLGVVSLLASALMWAFGNVWMKYVDLSSVSPIMLVGVQLYMSAAVLFPAAFLLEGLSGTEFGFGLLWPLLYAAIPANAGTFALMALVVRYATPTQASATTYLIPLFGVLFGWLIHNETLQTIQLLGGALAICGVALLVTALNKTNKR